MFWKMGYFTPLEVALCAQDIVAGSRKRFDLTDLDVVGIKFEDDLTWHTVVADCKSGKESAVNRLFWLRGVADYFRADRAYLVMPSMVHGSRELALALNVSLLDEDNLSRHETDRNISESTCPGFTVSVYDHFVANWGIRVEKGAKPSEEQLRVKEMFAFFSYRYWLNEEYRNVLQSIDVFDGTAELLSKYGDNTKVRVIVYSALALFSVSFLKLCGSVISIKAKDIHHEVRRYMFGGTAAMLERSKLMEVVSGVIGKKLALEPSYYDELLELANRLIKFSTWAKDVPRYLDLHLRTSVLGGSKASLEDVLGDSFSVDTLKLAKDVSEFFCRAANLDLAMIDDLVRQ